jgi:hypothetical protein
MRQTGSGGLVPRTPLRIDARESQKGGKQIFLYGKVRLAPIPDNSRRFLFLLVL